MPEGGRRGATLGADDLAALWSALPVARLSWAIEVLPNGVEVPDLFDDLRAAAWRQQRSRGHGAACCVEQRPGERLPCEAPEACVANALFPVGVGGGAEKRRMATLFIRWLQGQGCLHTWALGATASAALPWAGELISERLSRKPSGELWRGKFGERVPTGIELWDLDLVTSLIGSTTTIGEDAGFEAHLHSSLAERARKFTALCLANDSRLAREDAGGLVSRLLAFGSWHISNAVLQRGVRVVDQSQLRNERGDRLSRSSQHRRKELRWIGRARLRASEEALPWLTILAICGAGKNPDKGHGSVELTPVLDA